MTSNANSVDQFLSKEYEHGFVTDIESDTLPPGLNEEVIRHISDKKNEPDFSQIALTKLAFSLTHVDTVTLSLVTACSYDMLINSLFETQHLV